MDLLDVNLLIYAHSDQAARHGDYKRWLTALFDSGNPFAVPSVVISSFLRIVTNPRAISPPSSIADAIRFTEQFHAHVACQIMVAGPRHWSIFSHLCQSTGAYANHISDAYLAALAIENNCELVTADHGFGRWPGLKWRHLLDA